MSEDLKSTVNLPQTDFPIRAGLATVEPELLAKWEEMGLADQLGTLAVSEGQSAETTAYVLHDGPPYPNGDIHMGHALNKILKDVVRRTRRLFGDVAPYVPGWDCHGLPIETQVIKELKSKGDEEKKADIPWFRQRCKDFALGQVSTQKESFKRLGIEGEWGQPYLTLNPEYEVGVLRAFSGLAKHGLVYKGRKPIHWCMHCETALAEAEIEYQDHKSPSVTVRFEVTEASPVLASLIQEQGIDETVSVLVWTTTPWTLPSNVALAVHQDIEYQLFKSEKGVFIAASALVDGLSTLLGLEQVQRLVTIKGEALLGTMTQHPFYPRSSTVYSADFVTDTDGTGFVHIAPGHGQDDYLLGIKHSLPILMPVDDEGRFTTEVEAVNGEAALAGQRVFDANKTIGMGMDATGHLLKLKFISHSYPHCWRCKQPVIFRATEQWFVAMDQAISEAAPAHMSGKTLRELALQSISETDWVPDWGEKRIRGMIEGRPDWCVSRQRYWGIPIPVFHCKGCGQSEMTGVFSDAVLDLVAKEGTAAWFSKTASEILPDSAKCCSCGGRDFEKESDILDVWFESGASWVSVLQSLDAENSGIHDGMADLYLEGSDQHRGWFQSSMLIGLGLTGHAPFHSVLTHGFVVDDKGHKMSKSQGNVIKPETVIRDYGADVLRWWVCGMDFKQDISVSQDILNQSRTGFSKVRNTLRFLLSNLYDFDYDSDAIELDQLSVLDQWILSQSSSLVETAKGYIEAHDYHLLVTALYDFSALRLSSDYLDMVKDRLYCGAVNSHERRSTQTALYLLLSTLLPLLSPILVFSAEAAYAEFNKAGKKDSVHLEDLKHLPSYANLDLDAQFSEMQEIKDALYQTLEGLRAEKALKNFLEAKVLLRLPKAIDFNDWESFLIVSQVQVVVDESLAAAEFEVSVLDESVKCERCWRFVAEEAEICGRCAEAIS